MNKWTAPRKSGEIPCVSTRFSLSVDNEQADAGQDSRTRLTRPNSQTRKGDRENNLFPCSADHEQDWNLIRLVHGRISRQQMRVSLSFA